MQPTMENYYNTAVNNSNSNGYPRLYNDYVNQPSIISAASANPNQLYYPMANMFPTNAANSNVNNNQAAAALLQQVCFNLILLMIV
jgi:hypothetical protein